MNWQFNPFLLIPLFSAFLTAGLAWFGWRKRPAAGAFEFFLAMLAVTVWGLGNALELGATNLPTKFFWLEFEYIGILLLPAAWLAFALRFTGHGHWLTRRFILLLAVEPILSFVLLLTSGSQHLFFQEVRVAPGEGILYQWDIAQGLFFWINIAYSYGLILLGSFLLLRYLSRARGKMGGGEMIVVVGVIFPWMANVLSHLYELPVIPGVDLTPFALSLTGLAFAWGLFRLRLLEPHPDALDALPEELTGWRARVLDGMLRGVFVIWLFAIVGGVNNVMDAYQNLSGHYENALLRASLMIFVMVASTAIMGFITFKRNLPYDARAGVFLFILYFIGALGLYNTALSGDGRVLFFALVILTAILFDLIASVIVLGCVLLTYVVIGWLQVSETITVPLALQANAADPAAWLSGGIVFLALSAAALPSVSYLLRALEQSLEKSREALAREQRLSRILRMVSDINQLIVRETDPQKLLAEACRLFVSGRGYAFAWIGLIDADGTTLKLAASAGETLDPELFTVHLEQAGSIHSCAANAIRSRNVVRVTPADGHDPCEACPRRIKHPQRTAIALPLLRENYAFGVLVMDHTLPSAQFDEQEIELLQELANDLAFALEKLEIDLRLQAHLRQDTLVNEIIRSALETPDLETMLQSLTDHLCEMAGADACYIVLLEDGTEKFIPAAATGPLREAFQSIILDAEEVEISASLLQAGQPLIVNDAQSDPRISPRVAETYSVKSMLGLPLHADDQELGAAFLVFNQLHPFNSYEISFAERAAVQVSFALSKAILYKETRTKAAELGSLYAAAQDMASSIMDPPALLQKLARHMTEALKATSGSILTINLAEETLQVVGEYWSADALPVEHQSDLGRVYSCSDYSTVISSMSTGQMLVIHKDSPGLTQAEQDQFEEYGVQSMMFVPIMAHGQLFGDIEIWESRGRREFTLAEIHLAQAMAGHAASIIQNANLVNAVRTSEARYRTLIEQASDGIFIATPDRHYVDVNTAGCQMTGYTREEILKMTMEDLTPVDAKVVLPEKMQDLRAGKTIIIERSLKRKDGTSFPVEISAKFLLDGNLQGIVRDITERKRIEEALREQEKHSQSLLRLSRKLELSQTYAEVLDAMSEEMKSTLAYQNLWMYLFDDEKKSASILFASGPMREALQSEEGGVVTLAIQGDRMLEEIAEAKEIVVVEDARTDERTNKEIVARLGNRTIVNTPIILMDKHLGSVGTGTFGDEGIRIPTQPERDFLTALAGHMAVTLNRIYLISQRKQAEEALVDREAHFRALIENSAEGVAILDAQGTILYLAPSEEKLTGFALDENLGKSAFTYMHPDDIPRLMEIFAEGASTPGAVRTAEYRLRKKDGEWRHFELTGHNLLHDPHVAGIVVNYRDITEKKAAEDALNASEKKFRALAENIPSVVYICRNDARYSMLYLNDAVEELTGHSRREFLEEGLSFHDLYHPQDAPLIPSPSENDGIIFNSGPFHLTYRIRHKSGEWRWVDEWGTGVVDDAGHVQYIEGVMIDTTERKLTEENLIRRALELEALSAASAALRTAQNIGEMIPVVARQALRMVGGDFSSIFLREPDSGDYISQGWYSSIDEFDEATSHLRHRPGEGITGHVAVTGEIHITENMREDPYILILDGEQERMKGLQSGISLPLRAHNEVIGVLHVWTSERRSFNEMEIRLLIAAAEMAGNALHRAMLFEQTRQHAEELSLAYDSTLAGWARALELRDEITEGHTRRVTGITLRLARALQVPENEIVNIRRGALLHDIGKMGIPDSILHKPGPFTMQERAIMERHTQYAYEMLSSIPFLRTAIDIPYCHHEHWDGRGYPRKLKGQEIPLAARIFTVIDVWDALTSDRPYRPAWSKERTRDYIAERAGKQFDPHVVEVFFSLNID